MCCLQPPCRRVRMLLCLLIGCKSLIISASNCCDLLSVIQEVREVVGRLIWETGDEQHESEASTVYCTLLRAVFSLYFFLSCIVALRVGVHRRMMRPLEELAEVGMVPFQFKCLDWCDLKAVLLSLFSCCSLYSVQQHLTHTLCKVKTLCVHTGIILHIVTHVQVSYVDFIFLQCNYKIIINNCIHSSRHTHVMSWSCLGCCCKMSWCLTWYWYFWFANHRVYQHGQPAEILRWPVWLPTWMFKMLQLQSSLLCTAHMSHSERQEKLSITTTKCIIKVIIIFALSIAFRFAL